MTPRPIPRSAAPSPAPSRPRALRSLLAHALVPLLALLSHCGLRYAAPTHPPANARAGRLAPSPTPAPSPEALCRDWTGAMASRDRTALDHVSFPETDPAHSCFVPVRYTDRAVTFAPPTPGCAYPDTHLTSHLASLSADPVRVAALLTCDLAPDRRAATLAHDLRTLAATSARLARADAPRYPYAAVMTFGYGWPDQDQTTIAHWMPGDACTRPTPGDLVRLGAMIQRARRVADALHAGVAPVAIVSGGAIHSHMVEAFALLYLLHCELGIARDRVLLEPCAQHTHTNIRNCGRWMIAMGARTGYMVTDDGIQADYLEDYGGFEPIGGSIDQRSLRDWHHLVGAWRRAAVGPSVGFWYTPYRFWAEPRDGFGSVACVDPVSDTRD